jgi:hypothetical protein
MKPLKLLSIIIISLFIFSSCVSVSVSTNYDKKTDFHKYKTFAFYKKGIDESKISDVDKRRILHAIENELLAKGMTKSDHPDVLVSIFAKSVKQVDIDRNTYVFPSYYGPYYRNYYSKYIKGTLLIDLIDSKGEKLLWQGVGKGALSTSKKIEKKEERINEFVAEIMNEFPLN